MPGPYMAEKFYTSCKISPPARVYIVRTHKKEVPT
mgnify:FL=1